MLRRDSFHVPADLCMYVCQGNVKGQFVIALPDGRIQTTSYTADPRLGFVADVSYQGEASYPDTTN